MSAFEYWLATELEVIDFVSNHLLKQGAKSISDGACMYRHPYGLMCAAGCLIPADMYVPEMERKDWRKVLESFPLPRKHTTLIDILQGLHDTVPVSRWPEKLAGLRSTYYEKERDPNE